MRIGWYCLVSATFVACDGEPATSAADAAVDRPPDAAPMRCTSDRDCSASGLVCDTVAARCVECNRASDCGGERACLAGRCFTPTRCTTSRTCPGQVCSARLGYCVDCEADVDCGEGRVCRANLCALAPRACRSSRECSAMGQVCDVARSICVECASDADCPSDRYCGAESTCAARACVPDASSCASDTRVRRCDARGTSQTESDCPTGQACRAGRCQAVACAPGTSACVDDRSARVCAADGGSYATFACTAACAGGRCANWACVPGGATCAAGGGARMVCNADGLGSRAEPCPTPPGATNARCVAGGACTFDCAAGFADCDGAAATGCEAALATDARHCGACGGACPAGVPCAEGRCGAATTAPPMAQGRFAAATAVLADGRVLVAGGFNGDPALSSTELYDPVANRWSFGPPLPVRVGAAVAARARDGSVLVFGGTVDGVGGVNTVYRFDPAALTWRAVAPLATIRSFAAAAPVPDGRILLLGGYRGTGGATALTAIDAYDPATDRWSPLPTGLNPERGAAAAAPTPTGQVVVFGGYNSNGSGRYVAAAEVIDPTTGASSGGPSLPSAVQGLAAVLASDGLVHVVGGRQMSGNVAVHAAYDPVTRTFRMLAPLPAPRAYLGLVEAPRGTLLAIGGREGASDATVATVSAYSLATDTWR